MSTLWEAVASQRPPEDAHQEHARGKADALPVQDLPLSLPQNEPGDTSPATVPQDFRLHKRLLPFLFKRRGKAARCGCTQCQQEAMEEEQASGEKNRPSYFLRL